MMESGTDVSPREEWRPVFDMPGFLVSSLGRVRGSQGKILKRRICKGYDSFHTTRNNRDAFKAVHVAVIEAFVCPRPGPGYHARHLNGNALDNRAENLDWGTVSENQMDKLTHGTATIGERNNHAKLKESDIPRIRDRRNKAKQLAVEYGVSESLVYLIRKRQIWKHVA